MNISRNPICHSTVHRPVFVTTLLQLANADCYGAAMNNDIGGISISRWRHQRQVGKMLGGAASGLSPLLTMVTREQDAVMSCSSNSNPGISRPKGPISGHLEVVTTASRALTWTQMVGPHPPAIKLYGDMYVGVGTFISFECPRNCPRRQGRVLFQVPNGTYYNASPLTPFKERKKEERSNLKHNNQW